MDTGTALISDLSQKASLLEQRVTTTNTKGELWNIAQEAAKSYHILVVQLFDRGATHRDHLSALSKRFGSIENQAIKKFYGNINSGPAHPIL